MTAVVSVWCTKAIGCPFYLILSSRLSLSPAEHFGRPPAALLSPVLLLTPPSPHRRTLSFSDSPRYGKELEGVDPSCREQYLDDKEFVEVFGMSKAAFSAQPKWKQVAARKAKELF